MKDLASGIVLAYLLVLMPTTAAFGQQQTANPEVNVRNAGTYNDRGLAKEKKGAMANYNQAIKLNPKNATAYNKGIMNGHAN